MTTIEPGDLLYRSKWPVTHKGVATPDGRVFHNTPQQGEHVSTIQEFSNGKQVRVRKSPEPLRNTIMQRLVNAIHNPKGYSYTSYNCDHSSSKILSGNATSPQLVACALIGGLILYKVLKN